MSLLTRFQNLAAAGADTNPYEPATHLALPGMGENNESDATIAFTSFTANDPSGFDTPTWQSSYQLTTPTSSEISYSLCMFDPKAKSVVHVGGRASTSGVVNMSIYNVNNPNSPSYAGVYRNATLGGQFQPKTYALSDRIHHTRMMGCVYNGEVGDCYIFNTGIGTGVSDWGSPNPLINRSPNITSIPTISCFFNSHADNVYVQEAKGGPANSYRVINIYTFNTGGSLGGEFSGLTLQSTIGHPQSVYDIYARGMVKDTNIMFCLSGQYKNGTSPTGTQIVCILYDISNPASPVVKGEVLIDNVSRTYLTDFYTASYDNYVVLFAGNGSTTSVRIFTIDCSDPDNPSVTTATSVNTNSDSTTYVPNWVAWDQGSNAAYVMGTFGTGVPRRVEFSSSGGVTQRNFLTTTTGQPPYNTWFNTKITNYPGTSGSTLTQIGKPAALYF